MKPGFRSAHPSIILAPVWVSAQELRPADVNLMTEFDLESLRHRQASETGSLSSEDGEGGDTIFARDREV
jgi:hypothetical protein